MAAESMYQAIVIAYLPASESSSKLDVQCHTQSGMRNYGNPAMVSVNRLWAPPTIKFKLYKMESDKYRLTLSAWVHNSEHSIINMNINF